MKILALDHIVLTVASIEASVDFYAGVLGMARKDFGVGRVALQFGRQKINLHRVTGETASPRALAPVAGSGDICLIVASLAAAQKRLRDAGIKIITGPVDRTGARGPIRSIYCNDPDGNLVELTEYVGPVA